jgi:hypothetical protein
MNLKNLVDHYKTQALAAAALGVSQATISRWGKRFPIPRQYQIQVLTGGKLKAEKKSA